MLDDCERFIKAAEKEGVQAEVYYVDTSEGTIELEGTRVVNSSTGRSRGIGLRVIKAGTLRFLHSTDFRRPEALIEKCAKTPGPFANFSFPSQPERLPEVKGIYDTKITEFSVKDAVASAKAMQDAVKHVSKRLTIGSGSISWSTSRVALCNTEGLEVEYIASFMAVNMYCVYSGTRKSSASSHTVSRSYIEHPESCAHEAAELAVSASQVAEVKKVEKVVLSPDAAADIFGNTLVPAVIGQRVEDQSSVLAGRSGEHVGGELTVMDSGLIEGGMGTSSVDDEGVPSRENTLIEKGVFRHALYELNTAGKYSKEPTSSGVRSGYDDPPSGAPRNLVISVPALETEDPVSEVDYGILVYDVHGAHTANPTTSEFTVNTGTAFVVENGEIKGALRTGILIGDLFTLLKGISALGKERKWVFPGPFLMPYVVIDNLKVFI